MAGSTDWFRNSFRAEYEKQNAAIGRFNLAIFGKTGVGKSTLINAIFGEEVARTGIGEPVTRGSHLYLDKIGHLGIVDTQGLEVGKDNKEILSDLDKAMTQMRSSRYRNRSTWPGIAFAAWIGASRRPRRISSVASTRWVCR